MKNLLILVTAIVFFSSCSIVKKSTSSKKEKVFIENKTSIDTSSSAFSKEDFTKTEEVNNAVKEEAQYNNVVEIRFDDEDTSTTEMQDFSDHTEQDYLPDSKTKIKTNAPAKIKISKNGELEFSGKPSSIKIKNQGSTTKIDSSQSASKINRTKTDVIDKKGVSISEVKAEAEKTENESIKQKWRFNLIWLLWLLIIPVIRYSWQHWDKIKIWLFGH